MDLDEGNLLNLKVMKIENEDSCCELKEAQQ